MSPDRQDLLVVAARVPVAVGQDCVLVAIDGIDGAGKTTFADQLAGVLRDEGREVIRILLDDFHNTSEVRYAQGRHSPEGYWLDSFNYARFHSDILEPLGRDGSRQYRPKAHDLSTDQVLTPPTLAAAPGSVVVIDGLFMHRDELADLWDFSVFLDVPFEVSTRRLAQRDGSEPDMHHPSRQRYLEGQRIYLASCNPEGRATLVIDNGH